MKIHKPGCLASVQCLVVHPDGRCPGPYGKCTCDSTPNDTARESQNQPDHTLISRSLVKEKIEKMRQRGYPGVQMAEFWNAGLDTLLAWLDEQ